MSYEYITVYEVYDTDYDGRYSGGSQFHKNHQFVKPSEFKATRKRKAIQTDDGKLWILDLSHKESTLFADDIARKEAIKAALRIQAKSKLLPEELEALGIK